MNDHTITSVEVPRPPHDLTAWLEYALRIVVIKSTTAPHDNLFDRRDNIATITKLKQPAVERLQVHERTVDVEFFEIVANEHQTGATARQFFS